MFSNKVEFPSKKAASQLKRGILDFFLEKPAIYCFAYEWMLGIVEPKSESEYIQNMFRFSIQGIVRRCDLYLPNLIEHGGKQYVGRLESFGDSKRIRMQAGVNPLAYSFGKIMLDYVFLFLEEKTDQLKDKMMERINKQQEKERYFTALKNIQAVESIFGVKMTEKKKQLEDKYNKQKKNLSTSLLSIINMQQNMINSTSNPSLSHQNNSNNNNTDSNKKSKSRQLSNNQKEEEDDFTDEEESLTEQKQVNKEEDNEDEEEDDVEDDEEEEDDDEEEEDEIEVEEDIEEVVAEVVGKKEKKQKQQSNKKQVSEGETKTKSVKTLQAQPQSKKVMKSKQIQKQKNSQEIKKNKLGNKHTSQNKKVSSSNNNGSRKILHKKK